MALYQDTLPSNWIRLLQWQDVEDKSGLPLRFHLVDVNLNEAPLFDALSYRWSDPDAERPDCKVLCNSVKILIGVNLYDALIQISSLKDRSPSIWVDTLCIDQTNHVEKQSQILLMPQAYSRARRAIIWLGPSDEKADKAAIVLSCLIDLLRAVDKSLQPDASEPLTQLQTQLYQQLLPHASFLPAPIFEDIWRLFMRDWFGRVWTLQEAALASDSTIVLYGGKHFSYLDIADFTDRYINDNHGHWVKLVASIRPLSIGTDPENPWRPIMLHSKAVLMIRNAIKRNKNASAMQRPVIRILNYLRPLDCTEPRDRVFSVASFLPTELIAALRVKGPMTAEALYTLLATIELGTYANTQCLSAAGLSQQQWPLGNSSMSDHTRPALKLSSWVPDWCYKKRHESLWVLNNDLIEKRNFALFQATSNVEPNISVMSTSSGNQIAIVDGILLDAIVECGLPFHVLRIPEGTDASKSPEVIRDLYRDCKAQVDQYTKLGLRHFRPQSTDTGSSSMTAIRMTLIARLVPEIATQTFSGTWTRARWEQVDALFEELDRIVIELEDECKRAVKLSAKSNLYESPLLAANDQEEHSTVSLDDQSSLKQVVDAPSAPDTNKINPILSIGTACKGRTFFATYEGRIGLGPSILTPGDRLCLFHGACTPFIIRPVTSSSGGENSHPMEIEAAEQLYQLVGECYVHGLMNGEGLKLPKTFSQKIALI